MVECGRTRVLCAVSVEEKVPGFLEGRGEGWVTAEYGMLPRATHTRTTREAVKGRLSGRTMEIQRLIGRSLRAAIDRKALGPRSLWLDCDVIQADGSTRCAAITGGTVALALAMRRLVDRGLIASFPLKSLVAGVSVGVVDGEVRLDLDYDEDSSSQVDLNVVKTSLGGYVEVQGTAEGEPFAEETLSRLLAAANLGLATLHARQAEALKGILP